MSHNGLRTIEEEQRGIDEFLKTVSVDVHTGKIIRTSHKRSDLIGKEVGSKIKGGYTRVYFKSKGYLRHRIIYYVATGKLPDVKENKNGVPERRRFSYGRICSLCLTVYQRGIYTWSTR